MATNLELLPLGPPHTFYTAAAQTALDAKISITAAQAALDLKKNIRVVVTGATTTPAAAANTEYVYLVTGSPTFTLPTAVGNTSQYVVKNAGAGSVTLATTGSQTINGSLSLPDLSAALATTRVVSDGANWWTT